MKHAMTLLFLTTLLIAGCSGQKITGESVKEPTDAIREIKIDAFSFGYNPDTITVSKGEKVKISINNLDVLHGMRIPDYGIKGIEGLEFIANKTGSFPWYCEIPCGPGHTTMNGTLVVT